LLGCFLGATTDLNKGGGGIEATATELCGVPGTRGLEESAFLVKPFTVVPSTINVQKTTSGR